MLQFFLSKKHCHSLSKDNKTKVRAWQPANKHSKVIVNHFYIVGKRSVTHPSEDVSTRQALVAISAFVFISSQSRFCLVWLLTLTVIGPAAS